jgi:hypothetical protein
MCLNLKVTYRNSIRILHLFLLVKVLLYLKKKHKLIRNHLNIQTRRILLQSNNKIVVLHICLKRFSEWHVSNNKFVQVQNSIFQVNLSIIKTAYFVLLHHFYKQCLFRKTFLVYIQCIFVVHLKRPQLNIIFMLIRSQS